MVTGAVVVDERNRVLCLRHEEGYALAEAEPEEADDSLSITFAPLIDNGES
ncbi:hypothetical protein ACWCRD_42820 [Streptomyces sp. NPDC002092]